MSHSHAVATDADPDKSNLKCYPACSEEIQRWESDMKSKQLTTKILKQDCLSYNSFQSPVKGGVKKKKNSEIWYFAKKEEIIGFQPR